MSPNKNSSEKSPAAEIAKTAQKLGSVTPHPKSKEIRDTLEEMGVQLEDFRIEDLAKQIAVKVKERVERARKREEEKAWKDELSPQRLVVALPEILLSGKRRGPKPKGSTSEASSSSGSPPELSSSSELPSTSPPPEEANLSLEEFKLVQRTQ